MSRECVTPRATCVTNITWSIRTLRRRRAWSAVAAPTAAATPASEGRIAPFRAPSPEARVDDRGDARRWHVVCCWLFSLQVWTGRAAAEGPRIKPQSAYPWRRDCAKLAAWYTRHRVAARLLEQLLLYKSWPLIYFLKVGYFFRYFRTMA